MAIFANRLPQGLSLRFPVWQAPAIPTFPVAIDPSRLQLGSQPVRRHLRQHFQRMAQSFPDAFQAVEQPDRGQHMGRISALSPARFHPSLGLELGQHVIQQARFQTALAQPIAIFAQDRIVEPRVRQLLAQGVFPINAPPHRIGGLAVSEPLGILHHADQVQFARWHPWSSEVRKQGSIGTILIQGTQHIAHEHVRVASGKGGSRYAGGFIWYSKGGLSVQRHGSCPPAELGRLHSATACPECHARDSMQPQSETQ